jgi:ribosome-associated heat shock protein Hsp15
MAGEGRQRIDKWLFFARIVKSRSLAAKLVQAGRVRVNREKAGQTAHPVKPGDVLTVSLDRRVVVLRIVQPGVRRGPFEEARTLYQDLSPQPVLADGVLPDAVAPQREAGSGRPTKKERREMQKFRDGD